MIKKSYILSSGFVLAIMLLLFLITYLNYFYRLQESDALMKRSYVKLSTLADLSLATEATYIRHRSLASTFSIYSNDANLLEDELLTFTISDAKIQK